MHVRLMSIETLANYLDASEGQVRKMVEERRLPRPKYNDKKFVRWDRKDVDAALDNVPVPLPVASSKPDREQQLVAHNDSSAGGLLVKAAQEALNGRSGIAGS